MCACLHEGKHEIRCDCYLFISKFYCSEILKVLKAATDGYIRRQKGMKIVHRIPKFRTYLFCETVT